MEGVKDSNGNIGNGKQTYQLDYLTLPFTTKFRLNKKFQHSMPNIWWGGKRDTGHSGEEVIHNINASDFMIKYH